MNRLVHCIDCDKVYLRTPFDRLPEYEWGISSASAERQGIERDDFQEFLESHRGHRLEDLQIIKDSFVSDKPYAEPVKVSYFKATNGREQFVIKRFRERIDEPLAYELIRGDYSLKCTGLQMQLDAIQKQLEREMKPPLSSEQMTAFLELCQHVARRADVNKLESVAYESSHPLEVYYKMDDLSLMVLLRNCHRLFKGRTYEEIEGFIDRHKEDGVLLLKATYRIEIKERRQAKRLEAAAVSKAKKASQKN